MVTAAGDVNADGYDDILVGVPDYDVSCVDDGVAMIFFGDPIEITYYPNWVHIGYACGDKSGYSVAGAGDVNADGYDDVIIGAPNAYAGYSVAGEVYMYLGGPEGPTYTPDWQIAGEGPDDYLGTYISTAGDYNGDGYDDILAGSESYNYGADPQGHIFLYMGNPAGLSNEYYKRIYRGTTLTGFARSFSGGGDVNNDGYDDFVVAEPDFTIDDMYEIGRVFVYFGKPTTCDTITGLSLSGITTTSAIVSWSESDTSSIYLFQWKKTGTFVWHEQVLYANTVTLSGLVSCQNYSYRLQNICTSAGASEFTETYSFTTTCLPSCSSPPGSLSSTVISSTSASVSWSAVTGATKYKVYYRPAGSSSWLIKNSLTTTTNLTGLTPGTIYQYKVKAICGTGVSSAFSSVQSFTTPLKLSGNLSIETSLFPNPTDGKVLLRIEESNTESIYIISITDVFGQMISMFTTMQSENTIDFNDLANGIYFITIANELSESSKTHIVMLSR